MNYIRENMMNTCKYDQGMQKIKNRNFYQLL